MLADKQDIGLTLFLRHPKRLKSGTPKHSRVVQVDVLKMEQLNQAMADQDLVYANLIGEDIDHQAENIVKAMDAAGVKRLIFVASLGIYDDVPGKFGVWNRRQIGAYLPPFRRATDAIEASGLDYTILRPAWLTDNDEVDYGAIEKNEPFEGTEVSRKGVAALIVKIIESPELESRLNLGVNKSNSDGEKPVLSDAVLELPSVEAKTATFNLN